MSKENNSPPYIENMKDYGKEWEDFLQSVDSLEYEAEIREAFLSVTKGKVREEKYVTISNFR